MNKIDDYQERAHVFAQYFHKGAGPEWSYPVLGLTEEAGEVAGKFAKIIRDQNGEMNIENIIAIKKELGDVCWMVSEIATLLDLKMSDILYTNIEKLQSRVNRGVIHGSGDNR